MTTAETNLANKVDKVEGKGLSTNDYTTEEKTKLSGIETGAQSNVIETVKVDGTALTVTDKAVDIDLATPLAGKVDKVEGKGLSTNDFTTAYMTKLDAIEDNAQENVVEIITVDGVALEPVDKTVNISLNPIREEIESVSYVVATTLNELTYTKVDKVEGKGLSANDFTTAYMTKLDAIESGAEVNTIVGVQVNGTDLTPDSNRKVNVVVPAATVTGVKTGEKIIGLDGTELTSTVTLNYDSASTKLQILGIGGTLVSEINASAFIKDGMLDYAGLHVRTTVSDVTTWSPTLPSGVSEPSGTADGTYIVLVWNTESGKSATFIDVTSLIDTYVAGTGLTLSNHTFSLNAATDTTIGGVKVAAAATSGLTLAADGSLSIDGPSVAQILALLNTPESNS
jgi:hypothetical protein